MPPRDHAEILHPQEFVFDWRMAARVARPRNDRPGDLQWILPRVVTRTRLPTKKVAVHLAAGVEKLAGVIVKKETRAPRTEVRAKPRSHATARHDRGRDLCGLNAAKRAFLSSGAHQGFLLHGSLSQVVRDTP